MMAIEHRRPAFRDGRFVRGHGMYKIRIIQSYCVWSSSWEDSFRH